MLILPSWNLVHKLQASLLHSFPHTGSCYVWFCCWAWKQWADGQWRGDHHNHQPGKKAEMESASVHYFWPTSTSPWKKNGAGDIWKSWLPFLPWRISKKTESKEFSNNLVETNAMFWRMGPSQTVPTHLRMCSALSSSKQSWETKKRKEQMVVIAFTSECLAVFCVPNIAHFVFT